MLTPEGTVPIQRVMGLRLSDADGYTPLGQAMMGALDIVEAHKEELKRARLNRYKPIVLLISDGEPTDDVTAAGRRILELDLERNGKVAVFPVFICTNSEDGYPTVPPHVRAMFRRPPIGVRKNDMDTIWDWLGKTAKLVSRTPAFTGSDGELPNGEGSPSIAVADIPDSWKTL